MTHPPTFILEDDGVHVVFQHMCKTLWKVGTLPNNSTIGWTVTSREPLTTSPSISCDNCGLHGWIKDGKWVPA